MLVASILMLNACKEKKQSEDIITDRYVPKVTQDPIAMEQDRQDSHATWQGKNYQITIERVPDDSLAMVADENGQKYIDNRITLTIRQDSGTTFFHRSFTKASFASYVDEVFSRNGLLASIRFDEVDNAGLEFNVVVGMPDAIDDLYMPLEMTIDRQGGIHIERDNDMDMRDYDNVDELNDDDL